MNDRKPLIAGNWKMFKTHLEAVETAEKLVSLTRGKTDSEVMISPTFISLFKVSSVLKNTGISLGAQNLHWETEGAFTGEISAEMLLSCGCEYVIIGHSERRQYFGETDESVNQKLSAAIRAGLSPVLCVGETENERESKETFSVLDKQIEIGLQGLFSNDLGKLVLAYEPVWAIGTGKTATSEQAQEVHAFLRSKISKMLGEALSLSTRIIYGGSVKPGNISELMAMTDIDGALVGGASLDAETFSQIVLYT